MNTQRTRKKGQSLFSRRFPSKAYTLARAVYKAINTPISRQLNQLLDEGKVRELVEFTISPDAYETASAFRPDYLAVSLLSKFMAADVGIDLEAVAAREFLEREQECSVAAMRLKENVRHGSLVSTLTLHSVLHTAREKIRRLLGPFDWAEAESCFGFGPGATFSRPHRQGDPYYKYREKPCSTYGCAILSYTALRRVPAWFDHVARLSGKDPDEVEALPFAERLGVLFNLVPGNRVTFVPKSATKVRTIAIEPTMNGYIQHGVGKMLERRLRRVGVDLHDQTLNQRLAYQGSVDGSLATFDLRAASDSVSLELCKMLLPEDWFDVICQIRSEVGTLPNGTTVKYSKVSSMGNGTTFGIESLVFWALCSAVVSSYPSWLGGRFTVYGDDIIVPTAAAHTVQWVLEACGFSLNPSKSFSSGPFRESCGKHYFLGADVTPFYIREDVDTVPRLIWFANQVRRWSRSSLWGLDSLLKEAYDDAVGFLPKRLQIPSIPDGFGDAALFGDLDEATPDWRPCTRKVCEGWRFDAWVPIVKTREFSDTPFLLRQLDQVKPLLVDSLYERTRVARAGGWRGKSVRFVDDASRVVPERRVSTWRRVTCATPDWPCYGPWL